MHAAAAKNIWTEERNLNLSQVGRLRETLIYILGRVGREPLPPEVWAFLAEHHAWVKIPEGEH